MNKLIKQYFCVPPYFFTGTRIASIFILCLTVASQTALGDPLLSPQDMSVAKSSSTTTIPAQTQPVKPPIDFLAASPISPAQAATGFAPASTGRVLYVSTTGSDNASGAQGAAWRTLAYAVSQLRAGDTLNILEGTYRLTAGTTFVASGTAAEVITVQGVGTVVIDGVNLFEYTPVFYTRGHSFIKFKNLTVNNARDAVEVSPGSTYIEIDGLKTNGNDFAVKINGGQNITVRNVYATNSRNAFRVEGPTSRNILFENIETYGAKDNWNGYDPYYLNGDGFILEEGSNITLRNIISANNWDGGFDIKASNVLVENVTAYGNKNNFKVWGANIVIKSSLSYGAKRQLRPDGMNVDGNGINVRSGNVKLVNVTFVDNEDQDIKINGGATVQLQNSIIARSLNNGGNMLFDEGGYFSEDNNVWHWSGKTAVQAFASSPERHTMSSTSIWGNPQFVNWGSRNFRLNSNSPALNVGNTNFTISALDLDKAVRVFGTRVDAGAYEFGSSVVVVPPVIPPVVPPVTPPTPTTCAAAMCGLTNGQTVSGVIKVQPNLTRNPGIQKVVYYLNGNLSGREYSAPFIWGGTAGFDTTQLANGTYTLGGAYTTPTGDISFTFTFTVNNTGGGVPPVVPPTTCTTAICGVSNNQTVSGVILVGPNLTLIAGVQKVSYYLNGNLVDRQYLAPFTLGGAAGFDTRTLTDGGTYTLSGAYTTAAGDQSFSFTIIVRNSGVVVPPVPTTCATAMCGIVNNQTVSGIIQVKPNLTLVSGIQKVVYYLDGVLSERDYTTPFIWGGATGFDTRTLVNGTHTVAGAYTTAAGDQPFSFTFTVNNSAVIVPPVVTPCTTPMCGVMNGQTVRGVITVRPNLTLNPTIRKISYYINGTLYSREYTAPFTMGGATGFDTRNLANGTHTISGAYTTSAGDVAFSLTIVVNN